MVNAMKFFQSSRSLLSVFWLFCIMWFALIFWAMVFQVDKSIVVSGVMQPYGKTFTVESSRDGKIAQVNAKLGDVVDEGVTIMRLDTKLDEVSLEALRNQLLVAKLKYLRFETLYLENKEFPVDSDIDQSLWNAERKNFETILLSFLSEEELLENEIETVRFQIESINQKIASTVGQRDLLEKQFALVKSLFEKGYEGELAMLEVALQLEGFDEEMRILKNSIVQQELSITTLINKKQSLKNNFLKKAYQGSYEAQLEIMQILDKITATEARVVKSALAAPVSGRISRFLTSNLGQFVSSGETVAEIVPDSVPLMMYVKIPTEHISNVEIGQKALVTLNNMDMRNNNKLEGMLLEVDGDSSQEENGGRYFSGIIQVNDIKPQFVVPGVQGSASLLLGKQTIAEYFLEPIWTTLGNSLAE